jgi:hypothetical protein
MARVSATASLGMKLSLGTKKKLGFSEYDNTNPHHSITIERHVDDQLTDEQLVERAEELHTLARKLVEKKVNLDIKEAKSAT